MQKLLPAVEFGEYLGRSAVTNGGVEPGHRGDRGRLLEIIVALAGIGTAVALFAVLKKQNEVLALGLVASRTLEAATIFVGVAFILSIVTLRKAGVGSGGLVTSHAIVDLYDRIFLLGQSFMPAIDDALLGFMLYQSRLVPRALSQIGSLDRPFSSSATSSCCLVPLGNTVPWRGCSRFRLLSLSSR